MLLWNRKTSDAVWFSISLAIFLLSFLLHIYIYIHIGLEFWILIEYVSVQFFWTIEHHRKLTIDLKGMAHGIYFEHKESVGSGYIYIYIFNHYNIFRFVIQSSFSMFQVEFAIQFAGKINYSTPLFKSMSSCC